VFADEPTAALDPSTAREVLQLLVDQAALRSATLLFSTHRISQIVEHVDRVIGLREGRVFFDIDSDDVTDAALDELYEGSGERA
jgi:phosphonate transport system ATP-binding protein